MNDTTPDPRATILDNQRRVERRLRDIVPSTRATLPAGALEDRLPGPVRADLAWMADMVSELEGGAPAHEQDAVAFVSAARRVLGALDRIAYRSWPARLERLADRARWVSMVASGAGGVVAGVLFVCMFWVGPSTPAGYDAVMIGAFYLTLGGVASGLGLMLLEWVAVTTVLSLKWARRHPARAAVWLTGLPLIGVFTYALAGLAGVVALLGFGLLVAFRERRPERDDHPNPDLSALPRSGYNANAHPVVHPGMHPAEAEARGLDEFAKLHW